jgi:hypothetical protein
MNHPRCSWRDWEFRALAPDRGDGDSGARSKKATEGVEVYSYACEDVKTDGSPRLVFDMSVAC